jgi:hypothetical protein
MLFKRSREIEQFATGLARDFARDYPLADAKSERNTARRLARAIDAACERAASFQKEKKLGVYGKAKLGTTFKWELKTLGYRDDFIDEFTRSLLLRLSR